MSLIEQAASRFLPNYQSLQPISSGFSGGRVYRVKAANGDFALKQYPRGYNAERLREIHAMQVYAAKHLSIVPALLPTQPVLARGIHARPLVSLSPHETWLVQGESLFDCSTWLQGSPLHPDPSLAAGDATKQDAWYESIAAGAAAIAEYHEAVAGLGVHASPAPAISERLQRLRELQNVLPAAITAARRHACISLPNPWPAAADCLEAWVHSGLASSLQATSIWTQVQLPIQWVLRDVHREHVLFQHHQVIGLIDFDAARRDTVAVDIARWAGSFIDLGLEKTRIWSAVLSGYQAVRRISACEQQLAGAMEEISWYLRLANWVVWVALERREFPDSAITPETRLCSLLRRSGSFKVI